MKIFDTEPHLGMSLRCDFFVNPTTLYYTITLGTSGLMTKEEVAKQS